MQDKDITGILISGRLVSKETESSVCFIIQGGVLSSTIIHWQGD